jgi:hypothetical protein
MSDTKSTIVKVRVEGSPKSITKVLDVIRPSLCVADESDVVLVSGTKARRYLFVLVNQDEKESQSKA